MKPHLRERWLVSYADLLTLLFAFFATLYALSSLDAKKAQELSEGVKEAFHQGDGVLPGSQSPLGEASLRGELEGIIARGLEGKVSLREERRGLIVSLSASGFFASGSAQLSPQAAKDLEEIVELLRVNDVDVLVEGHTDDTPLRSSRYQSNWELSAARAIAVVTLLSEHHLNPTRLSVAGYGPYRPIASNQSPEGRAKNRRVDLLLQTPSARAGLDEGSAPRTKPNKKEEL